MQDICYMGHWNSVFIITLLSLFLQPVTRKRSILHKTNLQILSFCWNLSYCGDIFTFTAPVYLVEEIFDIGNVAVADRPMEE